MRERDNGKAVTEYFIILGADENYRKGEEEKGKQPKVRLYRQIRLKIFTRNAVKSVVIIVVHWKMKEKLHLWDSFVIDHYVTVIEAIHCEWRSSFILDVRHVGSPFTWG